MILITVGTQKFPFKRLIKHIDELVGKRVVQDRIVAQIGFTDYKPAHFEARELMDSASMERYIREADLIITHAGTSSIIQALKQRKKVIVIPRRKKFSEHVDDHQVEIAHMFRDLGYIEVVDEIGDLSRKIELVRTKEYKPYYSEHSLLMDSISTYLQEAAI